MMERCSDVAADYQVIQKVHGFSGRTGLWTLAIYTMVLSLLAIARGSAGGPGFGDRVALVALSGFLVGFFLDPLARAVGGPAWQRFGVLVLLIFSLASLSNAIETALYLPAVAVAGTLGGGTIQSIILAAVLTRAARPERAHASSAIRGLDFGGGAIFIVALAVVWLPVYFLFETLDTPVVHWLEQGSSDVFAHPPLATMLGLELVRGLVHGAAMLGIAGLARGKRHIVWLWGALAIAILNGWLPILPVSTLPLGIRIANGGEITLSSITFAGIGAYLFAWLQRRFSVVA
jgi:hypothetical protein